MSNEKLCNEKQCEKKKVAVQVCTTSGPWPGKQLYKEFDADDLVDKAVEQALEELKICDTNLMVRYHGKEIDRRKSFQEQHLDCLIKIVISHPTDGGGSRESGSPFPNPMVEMVFSEILNILDNDFLSPRNWTIIRSDYPNLWVKFHHEGKRDLEVRCTCALIDQEPPSIDFFHEGKEPIAVGTKLFKGSYINMGAHSNTNRPFVCARGVKEYHTHSSHINDKWDQWRGNEEYSLIRVLDRIYEAWIRG